MDKKLIEKKLLELDEKVDRLQEPLHKTFNAIERLIDEKKEPESLDLLEFKVQLSEILTNFYDKMVNRHDEIIKGVEDIEKMRDSKK